MAQAPVVRVGMACRPRFSLRKQFDTASAADTSDRSNFKCQAHAPKYMTMLLVWGLSMRCSHKKNLFAQSPVMYSTCSWYIIDTFPSSMIAVFCLTFCPFRGHATVFALPLRMTRRQCMASMFKSSCWVVIIS